jgi:alcohol dehydrogenase class IV
MQERLLPPEIVMPSRTIIGYNSVCNLIKEAILQFGDMGVLVHGSSFKKNGMLDKVLKSGGESSVATFLYSGGEPAIEDAEALLKFARSRKACWIAAIGGGSVMDLAKVAAGLFNETERIEYYHNGGKIVKSGIPFIAAPTTAGTGSEATVNAVLTNRSTKQKKSIRHPNLIPSLVFLDASLLDGCPQRIVAQAGLDALTQAIEGYTSKYATWLTDCYTFQAVKMISANLLKVFKGERGDTAEGLLIGSYLAGIGFSMAKLGVVHGIAHPLGVRYNEPHGLICGVALPHALELNRGAMGKKYEMLAQVFGADPANFVVSLLELMGVVSPFSGKRIMEKNEIIYETLNAFATQANPKQISAEDVEFLLSRLFA